jgi:hypothetical protein
MLQQYARGTTGPVAALAVLQLAITASVLVVGSIAFRRTHRGTVHA